MKAMVNNIGFVAKNLRKADAYTDEICRTHGGTFVSLLVNKIENGYVCSFTFINYAK